MRTPIVLGDIYTVLEDMARYAKTQSFVAPQSKVSGECSDVSAVWIKLKQHQHNICHL